MATKTVLETLEAARKLIELPEHWTKEYYARDAKDCQVDWASENACRFCAVGAMSKVLGSFALYDASWDAIRQAMGEMPHCFNDRKTHKQVLAAFDAAIAKEREAQHGN